MKRKTSITLLTSLDKDESVNFTKLWRRRYAQGAVVLADNICPRTMFEDNCWVFDVNDFDVNTLLYHLGDSEQEIENVLINIGDMCGSEQIVYQLVTDSDVQASFYLEEVILVANPSRLLTLIDKNDESVIRKIGYANTVVLQAQDDMPADILKYTESLVYKINPTCKVLQQSEFCGKKKKQPLYSAYKILEDIDVINQSHQQSVANYHAYTLTDDSFISGESFLEWVKTYACLHKSDITNIKGVIKDADTSYLFFNVGQQIVVFPHVNNKIKESKVWYFGTLRKENIESMVNDFHFSNSVDKDKENVLKYINNKLSALTVRKLYINNKL